MQARQGRDRTEKRGNGIDAGRLRGPGIAFLAAALVALALPAVLSGQAPPAPHPQEQSLPTPQFNPAIAGGPAPDLDLLFTAQVAGWIEPCG